MKVKTTFIALTLLTFFAQPALAESGTYESVFSGSAADLFSIDIQNGKATAGRLTGVMTIVKSTGGPFEAGVSNTMDCALLIEKNTAGTSLIGRCTTTDVKTGAQLYSHNDRKVGDTSEGSGGAGKSTMVGGTGKFSGITGSCEYKVQYLPGKRVSAINKCTWSN